MPKDLLTPASAKQMTGTPIEIAEKMLSSGKNVLASCRAIVDAMGKEPSPAQMRTLLLRIDDTRSRMRDAAVLLMRALVFGQYTGPVVADVARGMGIREFRQGSILYADAVRGLNSLDRPRWSSDYYENRILYAFFRHENRRTIEEMFNNPYPYSWTAEVLSLALEDSVRCTPQDAAEILYLLIRSGNMNWDSPTVQLVAKQLPEAQYICSAFRNMKLRPPQYDSRAVATAEEIRAVDTSALYRYFEPGWRVCTENGKVCEEYTLRLRASGTEILRVLVFPGGKLKMANNTIDARTGSPVAERLMEDIRRERGAEIDAAVAAHTAELEEKRRREQNAEMERRIRSLVSRLPENSIALAEDAKGDVEFILESLKDYDGKPIWTLEMRVGQKKMYVVKDAGRFLEAFQNGETIAYGKGLVFTHRLENIVEPRQRVLQLLLLYASANAETIRNGRALVLHTPLFAAFLQAMQGNRLTLDGEDYLVRFNEVPCSVSLTRRCVLHSSLRAKSSPKGKLLDLGKLVCFLNTDEHVIDRLAGTEEQLRLYSFAFDNEGMNVEPVLDSFCGEVYSRFYSDIEVADELKDRVRVSELEIRAYFDFGSTTGIHERTELWRDGEMTSPESIHLPLDRNRYTNYNRYLEMLGFENHYLKDDAKILRFLSMDMTELKKHCKVYLSEAIQNKKVQKFGTPVIQIRMESNLMKAFLENSEYSDTELKKILAAIRKKKKFVLLTGDRIIDLSGQSADEFEAAVDDLGLDADHLSKHQSITVPQALRAFAHESGCRIDDYLYKMITEIRNFKTSAIPVPPVRAKLRPYQEEGFRWLRTIADYHVGGVLADDMGLGKTLQMIVLLKSDPAPGPDLVVCPKSLVFNWKNEFRNFDPDADVVEVYGSPARRQELISGMRADERRVYITSYESLRQDVEFYTLPLRYMILDEAQNIKNVNAQKSRIVKQLEAAHRFALTGTPIENSVLDLWSIFDFIMPGYLDDLSDFKSRYSRDTDYTRLIARRTAPFLLRRTKGEVLQDLPEKYERILSVEMPPDQRKLYDAFRLEASEALAQGSNAFEILPYLMRLRQICDDPALFVENYSGGSGKMTELHELIPRYLEEGHRILLFSQFVTALEHIEADLASRGISCYKITGDTTARDRMIQMNEFNAGSDIGVFLISLKAGGTGLNLTGADTVIHLDPWWNAAAENQASDRAHRIGQTRNVEVIKLICEDSIEQRVIELQEQKKDLIDNLISNSDKSVTGVSVEDISFILN